MAVSSGWTVGGAQSLATALANAAARTPVLMAAVVEKSAADLTALTQQNASGRPGPNAPTGDYRGSWRVEEVEAASAGGAAPGTAATFVRSAGSLRSKLYGGTTVSRSVGTDRAQARRLEYGFVGADSLGRVYDQAPLPHHGPAVDVIEPAFHLAMEKVAEQAVRW